MSATTAEQVEIPPFDKSKSEQLSPPPQQQYSPQPVKEITPTPETKTPPPPAAQTYQPQQAYQQPQQPQTYQQPQPQPTFLPEPQQQEPPKPSAQEVKTLQAVQQEQQFQQAPKTEVQALTEAPRAGHYLFGNTDYISAQRKEHKSLIGFGCIALRGGGAINFQGCLVVPKTITLTMICQATSLDFSRATFVHPITTITVVSACAGVRILIPRGVRLETSGFAICANFGGPDDMDNNFPVSNAPILRIRNYGVCATTGVQLNYIVDPLTIVTPQ